MLVAAVEMLGLVNPITNLHHDLSDKKLMLQKKWVGVSKNLVQFQSFQNTKYTETHRLVHMTEKKNHNHG